MPLQVMCECGVAVEARDEAAGKIVRCPKCSGPVPVPKGGAIPVPATPAPAPPPPPPPKPTAVKPGPGQRACPHCGKVIGAHSIACMFCGKRMK